MKLPSDYRESSTAYECANAVEFCANTTSLGVSHPHEDFPHEIPVGSRLPGSRLKQLRITAMKSTPGVLDIAGASAVSGSM
jgi:hypothetical protein